jgi:hypothetical protein
LKPTDRCGWCWKRTFAIVIRNGASRKLMPRLHRGFSVDQAEFIKKVVTVLESQDIRYMIVSGSWFVQN